MAMILCVDDEPATGVIVGHALQRLGHECRTAASVDEALRAVARSPFDLILSDFQMPGKTGPDLIQLRASDGYRTRVILMTGYGNHPMRATESGRARFCLASESPP